MLFISALILIWIMNIWTFFKWLQKNYSIHNGCSLATKIDDHYITYKTMFDIPYKIDLFEIGLEEEDILDFPDNIYVKYPNLNPEDILFCDENDLELKNKEFKKWRKRTYIISIILFMISLFLSYFF